MLIVVESRIILLGLTCPVLGAWLAEYTSLLVDGEKNTGFDTWFFLVFLLLLSLLVIGEMVIRCLYIMYERSCGAYLVKVNVCNIQDLLTVVVGRVRCVSVPSLLISRWHRVMVCLFLVDISPLVALITIPVTLHVLQLV